MRSMLAHPVPRSRRTMPVVAKGRREGRRSLTGKAMAVPMTVMTVSVTVSRRVETMAHEQSIPFAETIAGRSAPASSAPAAALHLKRAVRGVVENVEVRAGERVGDLEEDVRGLVVRRGQRGSGIVALALLAEVNLAGRAVVADADDLAEAAEANAVSVPGCTRVSVQLEVSHKQTKHLAGGSSAMSRPRPAWASRSAIADRARCDLPEVKRG